ncbi:MAG: NYN domain-containing protein [Acidobacteria bacterium]|nr:NYN domain-containing protein [Acidobacteriota bacterium]
MQERQNIAVFVDYDNIEIGVKSTLRREFDVSLPLDALKERGDIVAKFAYANWSRQEPAVRQMAENAVQMVQRLPSPRGDKNGADINLALDALEMAFTHKNVNAFAIISGDSDFIPLVNKLRGYGKTIYIVGGKAFTSNILQQNCHEFISYESLLTDDVRVIPERKYVLGPVREPAPPREQIARDQAPPPREQAPREQAPPPREGGSQSSGGQSGGYRRNRPQPLEVTQAMPLVERALSVLQRRGVQPQLGLLKSTMKQLDPSFNERSYGASAFSEFIDKMKVAGYIQLHGTEGRYTIELLSAATAAAAEGAANKKHEALPLLRQVLEIYKLDMEDGASTDSVAGWMSKIHADFDMKKYGYQEFNEFLNFAQDNFMVRMEPDEQRGMTVYLGAEFTPPAHEPEPEPLREMAAGASAAAVLAESIAEEEATEAVAAAELPVEPEEKPAGRRTSSPARKRAAAPAKKVATSSVRRPRTRKPVE